MYKPVPNSLSHSSRPVAVVGAGVTGLAAAYTLTRLGRRVRLFEAAPRVGGSVRTERTGGWLIESGPNTFQENNREILSLITELNLDADRVMAGDTAKKRFIARDGTLYEVPLSPLAMFRTSLVSRRSKVRVVRELRAKPRERATEVALSEFIRSHFGQEIVDYVLNPFISGIYAGDPEQLSTKHTFPKLLDMEQSHGSLLLGQRREMKRRRARGEPHSRLVSFRRGLQTLTDALARRLPAGSLELNARVLNIRTAPGAPWRVTWERGPNSSVEEFGAVVLATPADGLARLTFGADEQRPLALLEEVTHAPVASLFLGFRRDQVKHPLDGFGALVPAAENRKLLGVLFSSTLFPNRAPEGHVALTALVGGALHPELASLPATELHHHVLTELRDLLGIEGEPVFQRLALWPRAIPQYNLGYDRFLDAISTCEQRHGGLFIGGQVRNGISLPACLRAGFTLGEKAAR